MYNSSRILDKEFKENLTCTRAGALISVKAAYSHGSWIESGCRSGSDAGGCIKHRRLGTKMISLQI